MLHSKQHMISRCDHHNYSYCSCLFCFNVLTRCFTPTLKTYIHYNCRVWFLSACAYIPTARGVAQVGLIQDALGKIKWVWLSLRVVDLSIIIPKTFGALAKMENHVSSVIRALLYGE